MRKLTKKISMLMVLAMLVGLFSGVVSASAASKWSFKSAKYDVAVGSEINMKKNEYADFDLLKEGKAPEGYTVTWESSDEDVVWVNAKSGQLRADKAKKAEDGDKAVITANIVNDTTKKTHKVSFTIVVGEVKVPVYTVECEGATIKLGEEVKFNPVVKNEAGEVVKFATHKSYNGYFVDGKAIANPWTPEEAGEYTVTLAQFANKADKADLAKAIEGRKVEIKVVVKPAKAEFAAEQVALNTVTLTFNDASYAAAVVADAKLLSAEYVVGEVKVPVAVKSVAAVKDNDLAVSVVLYDNIINTLVYTFSYNAGEAVDTVTGTSSDPYRIEVIDKTYEYQQEKDLIVKVYNKEGVDITAGVQNLATRLSWTAPLNEDYYVAGSKIYFYKENKSANVKATLDMGLNDKYEEIEDLTAEGTYVSVKTPDVRFAPVGYRFAGQNNYVTTPLQLAVGDGAKQIQFKYQYKTGSNGQTSTHEVTTNTDPRDNTIQYLYSSSDKTVVMVDANGVVTAVAPGSTVVYIQAKNLNTNAVSTIGTVAINVAARRYLASANMVVAGDPKLSVTGGALDINKVAVSYTAKDQLGAEYENNTNFGITGFEIVYPADLAALINNGNPVTNYLVIGEQNVNANSFTIKAGPSLLAWLQRANHPDFDTIKIKLTMSDSNANVNNNYAKFYSELTILAKDVTASAVQSYDLRYSKANVDMKLNQNGLGDYAVKLSLAKLDKHGFYLGDEALTQRANVASVTGAGYQVVLKKDGNGIGVDGTKVVNNGDGTFTYKTVYGATSLSKMDKGTYSAELYKIGAGNLAQQLSTKTLVLTDSTEAVTVTVNDDKIQVAPTDAQAKEVFKFYRGGNEITGKVSNISLVKESDGNHIYVTAVTFRVDSTEMNGNFGGYYTDVTVAVNKLFTIE